MARLVEGIFGPIVGKIANTVGYIRKGQAVIRMRPHVPKRKKKRSPAQIAVNLRFKLVKSFISKINAFTNVGFKTDVIGTTKIAQNNAVSYNLKQAVIGESPDYQLDFTKVIVSKGVLPPPEDISVSLDGTILKFSWSPGDVNMDNQRKRDQIMLLAYLPTNQNAFFSLSGARRTEGQDQLQIHFQDKDFYSKKKDQSIEVYASFIADDRESISNSVYVGRIDL